MPITIAGRRVEFHEHFTCYDREDVECAADVIGFLTKVVVRFEVDQPNGPTKVEYAFSQGTLRIWIHNWTHPLGQSTDAPQLIGSSSQGSIYLVLASSRVGAVNAADVMILVGP